MLPSAVITCFSIFSIGYALPRNAFLPDGRIVGGIKVSIEDHPYQLSLRWGNRHICGASIVNKKWVVTAGHCTRLNKEFYQVGAGSTYKNNGTFYNILRIIEHPDFNNIAIDYDIALLEIEGEFQFNDRVKPIALASDELPENVIVNITGWGAIREGWGLSNMLMRVSVPIINRGLCKVAYKNLKNVTERMICAGNFDVGGGDSCQGDSGGPLTANNTLYGTVSWGFGCAQPKYPGVYANVAYFASWIRNITGISSLR